MKTWTKTITNLTMLTQFGLSFITPLLLCLGICAWLNLSVGIGGWVYIPGFFFGMGGSATVAYRFYLLLLKRTEKESGRESEGKQIDKRKKRVSFNRHI